jgi:hypothetical protein
MKASAIWFEPNEEKKAPTAAILDSQSVRTASQPGLRGYDAGKKITGRKRHVLVDTMGNLLAVEITPADVQDRDGARMLMDTLTCATATEHRSTARRFIAS